MRLLVMCLAAVVALSVTGAASAQTLPPIEPGVDFPATTGAVTARQTNTTGNVPDLLIAPGATGAETITTNSAAGGNARLPERPVPNGSAGGGGDPGGGG
ncbi:hypothetical protein FF100_31815 [Methylobacterium terricola]|uniref:Uncharacterized protein n=1 Tax=Methylobacterium terricola TaxID=2583531 RepID=A0A5C4L925_9HYPH|nr:hypothetical protein [Methylobacterium terricola]TNC07664.1 hypothetical protein FF100_31815 [Methylobacterium terricola]